MNGTGGKLLKVALSLVISAFFIWLTLRHTDLGQVWLSLKSADYLYLLPYLAILAVIHFCRVIRWGILLEPVGKPGFKRLNSAGAIGFMALVVVPFRLGELARPLLIAEKGKIRRSAAMASVVVERVVDGIAMAVVLIAALLLSKPVTTPEKIAWVRAGGAFVFLFFFALLVFLLVAYWKRELAGKVVDAIGRPISPRLTQKAVGMLDAFIGGLKMVPDRRKVLIFFLLTVVYWGINAAGMAILARGFGLEMGITAACAVLGVLVAGVMIPAGPGMLGTFQGAVIIGMQLFFPAPEHQGAVQAFAWILWAAQFGQQVLFGLFFLLSGHVGLSALWSSSASDEEPSEPAAAQP